ncbi:hypothetical protein AGMMS50239_10980 [Bacteroidia bacterium]|nr:hypothetical protein AGMMS50239_10980 [Bacteroidia bacterium]
MRLKIVTFVQRFSMSTKDKLISRFKKQPKDFTFDELIKLFGHFGFTINNKGKTSGSRVIFMKDDTSFETHKPHPGSIVKEYVMKKVLQFLVKENHISLK